MDRPEGQNQDIVPRLDTLGQSLGFFVFFPKESLSDLPVFWQGKMEKTLFLSIYTELLSRAKTKMCIFTKNLLTILKRCGIYISGDGRHPSV